MPDSRHATAPRRQVLQGFDHHSPLTHLWNPFPRSNSQPVSLLSPSCYAVYHRSRARKWRCCRFLRRTSELWFLTICSSLTRAFQTPNLPVCSPLSDRIPVRHDFALALYTMFDCAQIACHTRIVRVCSLPFPPLAILRVITPFVSCRRNRTIGGNSHNAPNSL